MLAHTVFSLIHSSIGIIGCFSNCLLMYLALCHSPPVIRSYSTLIINFALTDMMACLTDVFVQQRIIPAGISLGYVSNGACKYFGPLVCYVGYSAMLHFFAHTLWSLLLSFSYRYYILFNQSPRRKVLVVIIVLIYIPSLFQMISFIWAFDDPDEMVTLLSHKFPDYEFEGSTVSGTKNILCFSALFTILHMTLPVSPVYAIILTLRRKIIAKLTYKGVTMSKNAKNLHAQLLMALTYQALLPGFYLFAVISYAIGQLGFYHHPVLEYFTFSSTLVIPVLSPLSSFIFVTPYKRFIQRFFSKVSNYEMPESSTSWRRPTSKVSTFA